ncbi:MAG: hypothetical protein HKUEN02_15090 [Anaerolineaceae bacterium]|nr:MAG: hypothetical protein HKUEN02_15090 [Anaerolineaceae bacterium]
MAKSPLFLIIFALLLQACNLPVKPTQTLEMPPSIPSAAPTELINPTAPPETPTASSFVAPQHQLVPIVDANLKQASQPDVTSVDTAPEKRAPYSEAYDWNRLERPFTQDMTYLPDLDIKAQSISADSDWYYISIKTIGANPNNDIGIHFGVEIDKDKDGFGDYLLLARPPYSTEWTADNVQIFEDTNHNTAGYSATRSDAPFSGDGYDKLIHDNTQNIGDDIDVAWVRISAAPHATIQFAVKKSWLGGVFSFGVLADAGLKDIAKLDYVDFLREQEAGSPTRSSAYYPLKGLYAFDNICFQAVGFQPSGYEPKACPRIEQATQPATTEQQVGCINPSAYSDQSSCEAASCAWRINPNVLIAVIYYCTFP